MRSPIPHLALVALAILIGCGSNPGVPAAPPAGEVGVPGEKALVPPRRALVPPRKAPPPPRKAAKKSVAQPRRPVSPDVFYK